MKRELTPRAHAGFAGLIALLLLFAFLSYRNTLTVSEAQNWVEHTYLVSSRLDRVFALLRDSEAGMRGFVVTGDAVFQQPHVAAASELDAALEAVRVEVKDNRNQEVRFAELDEMARRVVKSHANVIALRKSDGFDAARVQIEKGEMKSEVEAAQRTVTEMQAVEESLLSERKATVRDSRRFATVTNLLTTLAAILAIGALYAYNTRYIRGRDRALSLIFGERERLRVTLASIGDGVIATDVLGRVAYLNSVAEKLTGWANDEAAGVAVQKVFHIVNEDTRALVENPVEKVLEKGATVGLANHTILISRDGTEWPIDDSAAPIRDENGMMQGVILIFREIAERRRTVKDLQQARNAAEVANRAKSEFLANMSHEIRTPMAAILGYSDLMVPHLHDDHCRNCVAVIKRNGQFLLDIINDILDLSRIEAGRLEIERSRFDVPEIVADVLSMMNVRAQEKNIELKAEYVDKIPRTIESDAVRLRQILVNLIGNAIKFTENGSVRVVVETAAGSEPPQLRFSVVDTGIGMSPEQQTQLFQPFSQGDGSINRRFGGTGLGLTISKRLAGMLGGDITVDSALNRGSTFSVTVATGSLEGVPMIHPDEDRAPPAPAETKVHPPITIAGRILIVDDRRDVRYLAQDVVSKSGAEVETADDGREAIRLIRERESQGRPFDLVVMDMQMPVLDGYQTARMLRQSGFDKPIVALTAGAMTGDRERCLEAGCNAYVSKPIDRNALLQVLSAELQNGNRTSVE